MSCRQCQTLWSAAEQLLGAQVDAKLDKDLMLGDPKAPRFVFWNRKLRPTPSGPDVLTFDLMSIFGKLRAGLGAIGIRQKPPGAALSIWCAAALPPAARTHLEVWCAHAQPELQQAACQPQ